MSRSHQAGICIRISLNIFRVYGDGCCGVVRARPRGRGELFECVGTEEKERNFVLFQGWAVLLTMSAMLTVEKIVLSEKSNESLLSDSFETMWTRIYRSEAFATDVRLLLLKDLWMPYLRLSFPYERLNVEYIYIYTHSAT